MSIFLTGATGYLGGYVLHELLAADPRQRVTILVRGKTDQDCYEKLWRSLQLHQSPAEFWRSMERVDFARGDLCADGLGFDETTRARVVKNTTSILHVAASLNRRSEKVCMNTNLRGTLSMIKLAQQIQSRGGLRRFSHVSTVAVAGKRDREVVDEDSAVDWERSDYDPYARTKKFAEHMVRELLPDVPLTFMRPSIVMGDARKPETSQFDMVRSFCVLADLPFVPMRPDARLDIVNADWVGHAIAVIHQKEKPAHRIYHLSSGLSSRTAIEIAAATVAGSGRRPPRFLPKMEPTFFKLVDQAVGLPRGNPISGIATLLKVFLPYITYDTVFDNQRAVTEVGRAPTPFTAHASSVYAWAKSVKFEYPYRPLPARDANKEAAE
jgi:thioester reductase-like protein